MTISNSTRAAGPFVGNGSAASFPFSFKVFSASDVVVVRANADAQATLTLGADYTIQLGLDQDSSPGGSVTLNVPLEVGYSLVVTSNIAELQGTSLTNQGGFYPKVIEAAFDRVTILIQQLRTIANRSLRFPLSDTGTNTELPSKSRRANNLLGFDENGNPVAIAPVAQSANALQAALAVSTGAGLVKTRLSIVGATLRSVQDKLLETISVKDFGAVGDGVTNDTVAIQYALSGIQTLGGGALYFPGGSYLVTPGVLNISNCEITLHGDGMNNTRLQSNSGTGDILTITQNDFTAPICVANLSIITFTQETHTGLRIVGNAVDSQLNRVQARCELHNIEVRGDNVATAGPLNGIVISNCHNLLLSKVYTSGRADGSGTRAAFTHMQSGVQITGSASGIPSDFTIQGCYSYHGVYGFNLSGGIEGCNFVQCYAVAVDYGYYSDQSSAGTRPWASFDDCHANVFVAGVKLVNVPQSTISNCLIYKRSEANTLTTGVSLTNCDLSNVHDNLFYNTVADYTVSGDFIGVAVGGASTYVSVHHNKMDRVQYGVNLVGSCQNTKTDMNIVSNLYGSGTPQEYKNQSSGSGNTRLSNPRFENSQKNGGVIGINSGGFTALALVSPDTCEIGDEFTVTAMVRATKDATAGSVKVSISQSAGTAAVVFQNNLTQAKSSTYVAASNDVDICLTAVMKISTAGSLTLTLSGATGAGGASIAINEAQVSISRR